LPRRSSSSSHSESNGMFGGLPELSPQQPSSPNQAGSQSRTDTFFLDLLEAIAASVSMPPEYRVDRSKTCTGGTAKERLSNARYVLDLADSMGAITFITAEDLVGGQRMAVLPFLASLWEVELRWKKRAGK
jgi:hypothetical protein